MKIDPQKINVTQTYYVFCTPSPLGSIFWRELSQPSQEIAKIGGEGRFTRDVSTCDGMFEAELPGVECLTRELAQALGRTLGELRWIELISKKWTLSIGEVYTDLMCASRLQT